MLSNQALGIYAAGVKPAEVWYFIPALICSSLFPAVMNAKMIDQKTYIKRFKGLLYSIFGLSFAVALFEFIFAKYIVLFLFGEPFLEAAGIIRIYTWAGIAVAVIMVIQQYLTIENKSMIIMFSSLVGAAVNIVLNILLIPKFEITGSAYATLISYFCIPLIIVAMLSINKRMKARRLQIQ